MNALQYLNGIDWARDTIFYALSYEKQNVDDTIIMANNQCRHVIELLYTRCLFSTNFTGFILNRRDRWKHLSISSLKNNIHSYKAINIELDVTDRLDHMFILVNLENKWYIIESYVNKYGTIIEPINIDEFIRDLVSWVEYGVNPVQWKKYFHADIPSRNRAIPHIYVTDRIIMDDLYKSVSTVENRLQSLINDKNSYIHDPKYECILAPYAN